MVFSLVMRKPARFQAAKNRRKKRLRPSPVSVEWELQGYPLLQSFSFYKARLLAGFSF
jgi:hypothetical protein